MVWTAGHGAEVLCLSSSPSFTGGYRLLRAVVVLTGPAPRPPDTREPPVRTGEV